MQGLAWQQGAMQGSLQHDRSGRNRQLEKEIATWPGFPNVVLSQSTVEAAEVGELGARQLANVAYGAARCDRGKWQGNDLLFASLAKAAERRAVEFEPQELANMAWALATVG